MSASGATLGSGARAPHDAAGAGLSWLAIFRLGLVQTALGAIVVLTTSTMNRVMVVELALPAMLPGALVALHHIVQLLRPRFGHGSDVGGRRTPWIIGGMAVLAIGGIGAALSTAWMASNVAAGVLLGALSFVLIGIGTGSAGTSLLVLLAKRVEESRRAAAATIVWTMMIVGFIVTAGLAGHFLDPFTPARLVAVTAVTAVAAFALTLLAVTGVEPRGAPLASETAGTLPFRAALAQVWADAQARQFTIFVFVSMLAYSAQDLILEPFAGTVFGYTPGESTKLSGIQNAGVLSGMLLVALAASGRHRIGSLRAWTVGGCVASAIALLALAAGGLTPGWPLRANVFLLGVSNGAFAVAAIGSMMSLAGAGASGREGVRMGLWGSAQAIGFAVGGFTGTVASDLAHALIGSSALAYASVFAAEGLLFVWAAHLALNARATRHQRMRIQAPIAELAEPGGRRAATVPGEST
jgi:BCD family chlorophyll transporter-like MFS transporter